MQFGFASASLTQVYTGNYSTVMGDNLFNFSTPFEWDGNSNIVVNLCFDNGAAILRAWMKWKVQLHLQVQ